MSRIRRSPEPRLTTEDGAHDRQSLCDQWHDLVVRPKHVRASFAELLGWRSGSPTPPQPRPQNDGSRQPDPDSTICQTSPKTMPKITIATITT